MKALVLATVLGSLVQVASADVSIDDNNVTTTVDCAKDPLVNITGNHATVTLTGVCKGVQIAGNNATVTGSALAVSLPGNNNTATLDAVDLIATAGNKNTVTYKKTVDAKKKAPRISNPGNKNSIKKTK